MLTYYKIFFNILTDRLSNYKDVLSPELYLSLERLRDLFEADPVSASMPKYIDYLTSFIKSSIDYNNFRKYMIYLPSNDTTTYGYNYINLEFVYHMYDSDIKLESNIIYFFYTLSLMLNGYYSSMDVYSQLFATLALLNTYILDNNIRNYKTLFDIYTSYITETSVTERLNLLNSFKYLQNFNEALNNLLKEHDTLQKFLDDLPNEPTPLEQSYPSLDYVKMIPLNYYGEDSIVNTNFQRELLDYDEDDNQYLLSEYLRNRSKDCNEKYYKTTNNIDYMRYIVNRYSNKQYDKLGYYQDLFNKLIHISDNNNVINLRSPYNRDLSYDKQLELRLNNNYYNGSHYISNDMKVYRSNNIFLIYNTNNISIGDVLYILYTHNKEFSRLEQYINMDLKHVITHNNDLYQIVRYDNRTLINTCYNDKRPSIIDSIVSLL